ncbi:hypothetical protein LCGC14_1092680 [marine sediment metagenome]|uniref:Uncharacterized protein n=1 Tax=marine sediment metagenome TaxID=412755 RepID=A0A0F9PV10_9ZZZZ|nr:hypothetical protein [Pricia sp.]
MKVTKRNIQAILRESVFAPSTPGAIKAILDVGDKIYYVKRAKELLDYFLGEEDNEQLTCAITLLALAKLENSKDGD